MSKGTDRRKPYALGPRKLLVKGKLTHPAMKQFLAKQDRLERVSK